MFTENISFRRFLFVFVFYIEWKKKLLFFRYISFIGQMCVYTCSVEDRGNFCVPAQLEIVSMKKKKREREKERREHNVTLKACHLFSLRLFKNTNNTLSFRCIDVLVFFCPLLSCVFVVTVVETLCTVFTYNVSILMACFHRICFSCGNQIADVFILRLKKLLIDSSGFVCVCVHVHTVYVMMNSCWCRCVFMHWQVSVVGLVLLHVTETFKRERERKRAKER